MPREKTMENNEEGNTDYEGTIHANYLLAATNYLKGIPSNPLRSHWNILLSDLMHMKHLTVLERHKKYLTCEFCRTPWRNGLYSLKVMPKRKMKKKLRKLVRKVKERKKFSTIELKLANVIHTGPTVVVNCKVCHKSTNIKVPKDKPIASIIKETEEMKKTEMSNMKLKRLEKRNKRKQMMLERRKNKALELNSDKPAQLDDTKENSKTVQDQNNINNNNNDDDDVVIIDENVEVSQNDTNSKKRKLDDSDDDVIPILSPEPEKMKKVKKEDVGNSLPKTPFGVQSKQSPQCSTKKNKSVLFDNCNSSSKKNKFSKTVHENHGKQNKKVVVHEVKTQNEKKKNLSRWKKLIAEEEANVTKTSSLHHFLSTL